MTLTKRLERCEKAISKMLQSKPCAKTTLYEQLAGKFDRNDIDDALFQMQITHTIEPFNKSASSSDESREVWFKWVARS